MERGSMSAFDHKLALHCAPTLAGVKPANLISLGWEEWEAMRQGIVRSGRTFVGRQIFFRRLACCQRRVLLLVYRRDLLAKRLALPENRRILERYGYAPQERLGAQLARLAARIAQSEGFPHEIGVFLGYPPEDVLGFIRHGGKNHRLCGCWKVYGNPAEAKKLFSVYEHARCFFCQRVLGGEEIQNIQYGGIA